MFGARWWIGLVVAFALMLIGTTTASELWQFAVIAFGLLLVAACMLREAR